MDACIAVEGPLDIGRTLERYRLWGEDAATHLGDGCLRRAVRVDGVARGYTISWPSRRDPPRLTVSAPGRGSGRVLDAALAEARRLCGLDFDLAGFYRSARGDRVLAGLTEQMPGLRPTLMPQPLEMLIGSICAQQVNLPWAFTVRSRLVRRYGTPVRVGGATVYAFPEAEVLARATVDELRGLQFTTRKAEYITGLGRLVASGALDLHGLAGRANEDVIAALTKIRGLGRWTAEWFLARGLGRGDACPAGDLGVRRAVGHFYGRGGDASERAVRRRAARWAAHQNLAVHYLLAGQRLEEAMRREGAR